jgi:hypothetical protein
MCKHTGIDARFDTRSSEKGASRLTRDLLSAFRCIGRMFRDL